MNNTSHEKSNQKKDINVEIENKIYFTQMANQTVRNKNLTGLEKAILLLILSHNQEKFTISRKTLFNSFADSQHMIRKSLLGLKSKNYLKIVRTFGRWIYKVNDFGLPYHNGTEEDNVFGKDDLPQRQYKKNNIKKINDSLNKDLSEMCEEKKGAIVNNNEGQENKAEPKKDLAHTHKEIKPFGKTEQPHTRYEDPIIEELSKDSDFEKLIQSLDALNTNIGDEKRLATISREQEINSHYSNEIARVEQEYNLQRDINIPKLSIGSLLEASEDFLRRIGIGFDHSPRRILNLIYNQLPKDFVIKEDSKDVEILGDMIKKYMASRQDERESIAKRIYQSVEAMLKIYVIKKYGEPYREVLYPEILRANLVLYLNCNPTFKYCLGGFSNDIDGVYTEVCRLAEKDARKKIEQVKIDHSKKIRQLEANRQAEIQSMFSETEITEFQRRNDDILRRMDAKGDIEDMPLNKPIQANLTEDEKQELNMLFVKGDKTNDDVIRMNFLIRKSRK